MKKEDQQWKSEIQREERKERLEKMKGRDGSKKAIRRRFSWKMALVLVVIVAIAAGAFVITKINNGWFEQNKTCALVNGEEVKALTANFYCGSMGINMLPSGMFTTQGAKLLATPYGFAARNQLMRDFLLEGFSTQVKDVVNLAKMAREAGMVLEPEDYSVIENMFGQIKAAAEQQKLLPEDFMAKVYGRGSDETHLRPVVEQLLLSARYQENRMQEFSYTAEELEAKYNENKDQIDVVDYRTFTFNAASPELEPETTPSETAAGETVEPSAEATAENSATAETEATQVETASTTIADAETAEASSAEAGASATTAAADKSEGAAPEESSAAQQERLMQEAKVKAEAMLAKISDAESFKAEAIANATPAEKSNYENSDQSLVQAATKARLSPELAAWLYAPERKAGDKTVLETPAGYNVILFGERRRPTERSFSSRHILIKVDGEGEEAQKLAQEQIEKVKAEYEAGAKTEESFAALVEKNSQDPGSVKKGGLYENVMPRQFVKVYEEWCLNPERKPGDVGIVFADTPGYVGYHLIYFKSLGEETWKAQVEKEAREKDFMAWLEKERESFTYEEVAAGMKYVLPYDHKEAEKNLAEMAEKAAQATTVAEAGETVAETAATTAEPTKP